MRSTASSPRQSPSPLPKPNAVSRTSGGRDQTEFPAAATRSGRRSEKGVVNRWIADDRLAPVRGPSLVENHPSHGRTVCQGPPLFGWATDTATAHCSHPPNPDHLMDDDRGAPARRPPARSCSSRGLAVTRRRDGARGRLLRQDERPAARRLPAAGSTERGKHPLSCNPKKRGATFIVLERLVLPHRAG